MNMLKREADINSKVKSQVKAARQKEVELKAVDQQLEDKLALRNNCQ